MRIITCMGLLTAALIPLSLDQRPYSTTEPQVAHSAFSTHAHESIKAVFSTAARNAEIERSMQRVASIREHQFIADRNHEIRLSTVMSAYARLALVEEVKAKERLALAQDIERIRTMAFVATRNAEINRSMAAAARARPALQIAARNQEIEISMAKVSAVRLAGFAAERNAEIARSMDASEAAHTLRFAEARNREIEASIASVEQERGPDFVAARNAEIEISMARVKGESTLAALGRIAPFLTGNHIETGSLKK
jgi:hypothetical protein